MLKLYVWMTDIVRSERAQDMVEYALIVSVISIVIVLATIAVLAPAFTIWANDVKDFIASAPTCCD